MEFKRHRSNLSFHTMDIVEDALAKVAEKSKSYKTTDVEKLVDLDFDLGSLLAIDTNDLNEKKLSLTNIAVFEYNIILRTRHQNDQKAWMEFKRHRSNLSFHTMDIVEDALAKVAEKSKSYKTTDVEKLVDLDFDLGSLLAIDTNDLNEKKLRSDKKDTYLLNLARDNTQLLFNKIWALPTKRVEEAIVVNLPKPTFVTPREKPVPKPKPLTKWQQFAKEKGLQKMKKTKSTWDDVLQKWVPRHGYRKAAAEKEKDWLIEVPQNVDPYKDMFEAKLQAKQERVAKNEFQRLRNIAAAKKIKVPRFGLPTADKQSSEQLKVAVRVARVSTASIGKFQPRLREEKKKPIKETDKLLPGTRKRKQPIKTAEQEKNASLSIIDSIVNKKPKLDVEKAVNKHIFEEQQERANEKQKPQPKMSGRKRTMFQGKRGKGAGKTKAAAKPSGGKGKRLKSGGGRKRR